jgi:hypothetical protein
MRANRILFGCYDEDSERMPAHVFRDDILLILLDIGIRKR